MASHHAHISCHHHCQNPAPITATSTTIATCCCSCHYNHCCIQTHHPSPPPPQQLSIDPLLQALGSLLQQQQQLPNLYPSCTNKPHTQKNHLHNLRFHPQSLHFQQLGDDKQTLSVLASLLQRINSLESSLHHFSTSSTSNNHCHPSYSLREAAARIIQTHFRAFLVRRSRTLSQLQDLAFIKSSLNSLKSSISNKTQFNCEVISHKAMDLLLKLDSIQGGDPMIRDGKSSISRDIVRFLEFVDGLAAKRNGCSYKPAKNVRSVRNGNKSRALNASIGYGGLFEHQKEVVDKLSGRGEKIRGFSKVCGDDEEDVVLEGFQQFIDNEEDGDENPKLFPNGKQGLSIIGNGVLIRSNFGQSRKKKTVTFAENGNAYRVFSDNYESILNGEGIFAEGSNSSDDDHGENMDYNVIEERKGISKGTEDGEVFEEENASSTQSSDGEGNPIRNDYEIHRACQDQYGSLVFSAPVPVKMEAKADLMKKRQAVKIVK
ncbi:hypothetical protein P3X46_016381 [Hevea brasiliensis]|uniref:BAG domain-containing protein n=1 Tax=Hevea brasiliensis TaxID=3981 RepID=A0ABQ9LYX0_HEVBR|nr:BAG family molecular chaperone regulator 8, chloroplastic [Hevea brasiliensis]KAJ9173221.1 hypothetical protein P3X46_016381 [Hevea brasiliensis]